MRLFALSDLHIDYPQNAQWMCEELSTSEYTEDLLLLAGDISDDPRLLETCFREMSGRFRQVLFVPGNHDLWVIRWDKRKTSFDKFSLIREMARGYGISMEPFRNESLTIVPLLSWYDYSFGEPSAALYEQWADYRACAWPSGVSVADVTSHFLALNEPVIAGESGKIVSFSHFLPRIDIMPAAIPPAHRTWYPVFGTLRLDEQIRRLGSTIHIYGHSHVNRRVTVDGVTYINNAFGYPSETHIAAKQIAQIRIA